MIKYFILATIAIVLIATATYFWHQERKSNTNERTTVAKDLGDYSVATFAGGCFWCTESDFEKVDGVIEAISGYIGGAVVNPTYNQVSGGSTGHREASQVYYDPVVVSYAQLLDVYWTHVNPTDNGGQFADRGYQYGTEIFYYTDEQKKIAEQSKRELNESGQLSEPIVTPITKAGEFYVAEDYHQDYHIKNPLPYKYYRNGSGRNTYITEQWGDTADEVLHGKTCVTNICATVPKIQSEPLSGPTTKSEVKLGTTTTKFVKPSKEELKKILTPLQYKITQKEGTETPFDNEYWDNHEEGIYVDIVSGEPLFSSTEKFDSGSGWPSFLKPIEYSFVTEHDDYKLFVKRTEIRSKIADSHLGHIIMDGPETNDFVRYCMNSASMKFVHKDELEGSQYEKYHSLFE